MLLTNVYGYKKTFCCTYTDMIKPVNVYYTCTCLPDDCHY